MNEVTPTSQGQGEEAIIRTESLFKEYTLNGKRIEVLEGVNLSLYPAERVSIMGESGVGKSTLLHLLGALDKPSAGKIYLDGQDMFALSDKSLAKLRNSAIGFVFQFHYLLPDFTAQENVEIPMRIAKTPLHKARKRARMLLEKVGLKERLEHKPGELSGGEQQRVAIARALAMNPKIILADEPTGNLDYATSESIHTLLEELNKDFQTTLVVVTHDFKLADRMQRKLLLADGKIQPRGETQAK